MIATRHQESLNRKDADVRPHGARPARIRAFLEQRGVRWLYHFTPVRNLEAIRVEGLRPTALMSGSSVSGAGVSLWLRHPDTVAMYREAHRRKIKAWAVLRVPSHLCWMRDCEFWQQGARVSDDGSMDSECGSAAIGSILGQKLRAPAGWPDATPLEVRVRGCIATSMILTVSLQDWRTAREHADLLTDLPAWIEPALFCGYRRVHYE